MKSDMQCTRNISYFISHHSLILSPNWRWSWGEQHIYDWWPAGKRKPHEVLQVHGIPDHPRLQRSSCVDGVFQEPINIHKTLVNCTATHGLCRSWKRRSCYLEVIWGYILLAITSKRITVNLSFTVTWLGLSFDVTNHHSMIRNTNKYRWKYRRCNCKWTSL